MSRFVFTSSGSSHARLIGAGFKLAIRIISASPFCLFHRHRYTRFTPPLGLSTSYESRCFCSPVSNLRTIKRIPKLALAAFISAFYQHSFQQSLDKAVARALNCEFGTICYHLGTDIYNYLNVSSVLLNVWTLLVLRPKMSQVIRMLLAGEIRKRQEQL